MPQLLVSDLLLDPNTVNYLVWQIKYLETGDRVVDEGDARRHVEARPGDSLVICPFECDDCCFYQLEHCWLTWNKPHETSLGAHASDKQTWMSSGQDRVLVPSHTTFESLRRKQRLDRISACGSHGTFGCKVRLWNEGRYWGPNECAAKGPARGQSKVYCGQEGKDRACEHVQVIGEGPYFVTLRLL
jgi:hypothetical protein